MFKKQQGKEYHVLRGEQKLKGKNKQKEEFGIRKKNLGGKQQLEKRITVRDMYLFTAADNRKFLDHFMLVARFKHRDFPLAQNWSTWSQDVFGTNNLNTPQSLLCRMKNQLKYLSVSIPSAGQRSQCHENSCTEKPNAETLHKPNVDGASQASLCSSSTGLGFGITVWVQSQLKQAMPAHVGTQANKLLGLMLSF